MMKGESCEPFQSSRQRSKVESNVKEKKEDSDLSSNRQYLPRTTRKEPFARSESSLRLCCVSRASVVERDADAGARRRALRHMRVSLTRCSADSCICGMSSTERELGRKYEATGEKEKKRHGRRRRIPARVPRVAKKESERESERGTLSHPDVCRFSPQEQHGGIARAHGDPDFRRSGGNATSVSRARTPCAFLLFWCCKIDAQRHEAIERYEEGDSSVARERASIEKVLNSLDGATDESLRFHAALSVRHGRRVQLEGVCSPLRHVASGRSGVTDEKGAEASARDCEGRLSEVRRRRSGSLRKFGADREGFLTRTEFFAPFFSSKARRAGERWAVVPNLQIVAKPSPF